MTESAARGGLTPQPMSVGDALYLTATLVPVLGPVIGVVAALTAFRERPHLRWAALALAFLSTILTVFLLAGVFADATVTSGTTGPVEAVTRAP